MSGEDNSFNLWYYYLTEKTKHHYYYLNRLSWKEPTQHCTNWLQVTTLIVTLQLNVAVVTIKWYSRRHSCVFSQVQSCIYHAAIGQHIYTYVHLRPLYQMTEHTHARSVKWNFVNLRNHNKHQQYLDYLRRLNFGFSQLRNIANSCVWVLSVHSSEIHRWSRFW